MADNTFTIDVVTKDGGSTGQVELKIRALGEAVKKIGQSHKATSREAQDFYDTQAKGVAGIANTTKSFSKMAESIGRSNGLVAAYAELAANVFALTAAFGALREAAKVEQVMQGLEASGSRTGQALLVTARSIKEITGNTIDMQEALRATASITAGGFGNDTAKKIAQAAKDTSFALGRSTSDTIERLTKGLIKLQPKVLEEIGVMTKLTDSNAAYARQLGKTESQLSTFEKQQGFSKAVLDELKLKFGGLADEVGDTTAYEKLGGSLSDLKDKVLSTLNTGIAPLVNLLTSSPTALLGVIVLFASTLADKLLPFLASSVGASLKAAEAAQKHATAIKDTIKQTHELAQAQNEAEVKKLQGAGNLTSGPKIHSELVGKIDDGSATDKDFARAEKSLNARIALGKARLESHPDYKSETSELAILTNAKIAAAQEELSRIEAIKAAKKVAAANSVEGSALVVRAHLLEAAAINEAGAATAKAAAISAASQLEIRESIEQTILATKQYAAALLDTAEAQKLNAEAGIAPQISRMENFRAGIAATKLALKEFVIATKESELGLIGLGKVATYAAATGLRAAGSALLAAIPIIGQVIFALGILKLAWDYFKPESAKQLEKAFDDFGEVVTSTAKSIEGYNKIQESTAALGLRTQQSIIVQSNAINTLVSSYNELSKKQTEINKNGEKSGVSGALEGIFGGKDDRASYETGVDKSSKAFGSISEQYNKSNGFSFEESQKGLTASAKVLEDISKLAPDATEKTVAFYGGWDSLGKLPLDQFNNKVKAIANTVNEQYKTAAQNVADLAESFKDLDEKLSSFLLSQPKSTPFDAIIKGFQLSNNLLHTFEVNAAKVGNQSKIGPEATEQYKNLLTSIGPTIESGLSTKTQTNLAAFKDINIELQAIVAKGKEATEDDKNREKVLEGQRELKKGVLDDVAKELKINQAAFEAAQAASRLSQSQESLLQANLAARQSINNASAEGIRAQIEGDNKIKDLKISELELSRKIDLSYIGKTEASIKDLKLGALRLTNEEQFNKLLQIGNNELGIRSAREAVDLATNNIKSRSKNFDLSSLNSTKGVLDANKEVGADNVKAYQTANENLKTQIALGVAVDSTKSSQQQILGLQQSAIEKANQEKAVEISKLSIAQESAQAEVKRVEVLSVQLGILEQQRKNITNIKELEIQSNRLLAGRGETLKDQLNTIVRAGKEQKSVIDAQHRQNREAIIAQVALAQADANHAGVSDLDKAAGNAKIAQLQENLRLEDQGYGILLTQNDAQTKNNYLQKISFDTQVEGLNIQKDALQYLDKYLTASKDILSTERARDDLVRIIKLNSRGLAESDASKTKEAIDAAEEAYQLAVNEAGLKKDMIKLEFALLDAQRATALANLETQEVAIKRSMTDTKERREMLAQTGAAKSTLLDSANYIDRAQNSALKNVDKLVDNARLNVIKTAQPEGKNTSFGQEQASREQVAAQRARILKTGYKLDTDNADISSAQAPVIVPPKTQVSALEKFTTSMVGVEKNTARTAAAVEAQLAGKIKEYSASNDNNNNNIHSSLKGRTDKASLIKASIERDLGIHVTSDKRAPGQAGRLGTRSRHVDDHALDVRVRNNPETPDQIVAYLKSLGLKNVKFADESSPESQKRNHATGPNWHFQWDGLVAAGIKAVQNVDSSATVGKQAIKNIEKEATKPPKTSELIPETVGTDPINVTAQKQKEEPESKLPEKLMPTTSKSLEGFENIIKQPNSILEVFDKMSSKLGPQGTVIPDIIKSIQSVGDAYIHTLDVFKSSKANIADLMKQGMSETEARIKDTSDKITAAAAVASAAISGIQSVLAAGAQAKEDAIQREIAAEELKDGKSVASLAKIRSLEQQKDEIARKQFNTNKKLMMAQAVIATAAGIAQALTLGPIVGPIMAGVIGALGIAQIAIIAGTEYQSTVAPLRPQIPSLTVGKQGSTIDLAKQNSSVGGEVGYLRGTPGTGSNGSNYSIAQDTTALPGYAQPTVGRAYGGSMNRSYGNSAYIVGEKGPETIHPTTPITVRPMNDNNMGQPMEATINIHAIDSQHMAEVLHDQRGNIIGMLREAANASGTKFLENVNTNVYTRPGIARL